jgi:2-(3-amino-3-carboxypropyl)histidine synthase
LKSSVFDLEEGRLIEEVTKRGVKRVVIQLPEGLKTEASKIVAAVEKAGSLAIVSADSCYGACDLAVEEAESLGADLVIHIGHSEPMSKKQSVSIIFIEAKANVRLKSTVEKALLLLKPWKNIGLITTVQHVGTLGGMEKALLKKGKNVIIGDAGRLSYPGQVIGCDYSNAQAVEKDVDAFLFVGGGKFHAIGVALATSKQTVVADPYERRAYTIDAEVQRIIKQRWASIQETMKSECLGILIGLKNGQKRLEKALQLRYKLQNTGKKIVLLAIREVTPESLMQFPDMNAYVNTACPRISLDDASKFQKPVLTINEARVVAGELTWGQLLKKGWFED